MFSLHLCLPPLTGGDVQKWCGQQGALELSPLVPVGSLDLAFPLFFSARRFWKKEARKKRILCPPLPRTPRVWCCTTSLSGIITLVGHLSLLAFGLSSASGPSRCSAAFPQMFGKRSQSQALLAGFPQQIPSSQGRWMSLTQAESMEGSSGWCQGLLLGARLQLVA